MSKVATHLENWEKLENREAKEMSENIWKNEILYKYVKDKQS